MRTKNKISYVRWQCEDEEQYSLSLDSLCSVTVWGQRVKEKCIYVRWLCEDEEQQGNISYVQRQCMNEERERERGHLMFRDNVRTKKKRSYIMFGESVRTKNNNKLPYVRKRYEDEKLNNKRVLVQFSLDQFKMVSVRLEKSMCAPRTTRLTRRQKNIHELIRQRQVISVAGTVVFLSVFCTKRLTSIIRLLPETSKSIKKQGKKTHRRERETDRQSMKETKRSKSQSNEENLKPFQ